MRARKPVCAVADAFHACADAAGLLRLFGEIIRLRLVTVTLGLDDYLRWRSNSAAPCKALMQCPHIDLHCVHDRYNPYR